MDTDTKKRNVFIDNIQYFFFRLVTGIIRSCSLKTAYRLSEIVGFLFYLVDFKHRNRTIRHILHSGICTDMKSAKRLARKNLTHLVKVFVEITKFDQIVNEENYAEHVRPAKDPISQKLLSHEGAIQTIVATAHLGNWELAGSAFAFLSGIPMTSIMRPLGNPKIGEYFYRHRCSSNHKTVSREKGVRPLLVALKAGETVTIVSDQHANHREGVEVEFFGHPARAHATPALLHLKTGIPIITPYIVRVDEDFHFELHCNEPFYYEQTEDHLADVHAICQHFTTEIEKAVRAYPDQWLWAHRRWLDIERGHDNEYRNGKRIEPATTEKEK